MTDTPPLTRDALYAEVWSSPITHIAKRLGMSDRGLAKLCARHEIPVPPRGWWAKKTAGQKASQTPLLPLKNRHRAIITSEKREGPVEPTVAPGNQLPEIAFELNPANVIVVSERLGRAHPFVRRTSQALREAKPRERGLLTPGAPALSIRVSRVQVPRALRVMDALIKALDARGHQPELPKEGIGLVATVLGEHLRISLMELTKKTPRPPTEWERKSLANGWTTAAPYDLLPSGTLVLRIGDSTYPQYELRDGATSRIEDGLNHFVRRLIEEAEKERQRLAQREKQRLEREEQARIHAEQERLRLMEEERIKQWSQWMSNWKEARDVRDFAAALRAARSPIEPGSKVDGWLQWADAYALRIDPLG